LSDGYRCITIDLPGHGESDGPPVPLGELTSDVRLLLDELVIEHPLVVGHSMGAIVALIYAALNPVSGVVDVDQPVDIRPFIALLHRLEPALRGDDFATAFEPFRMMIGVHLLPEPTRSEVAARQRVRQDLVLGYWEEVLRTPAAEMQASTDG